MKPKNILLLFSGICFLIIMLYSIIFEPWFSDDSIPAFLRWFVAGGVILGSFAIKAVYNLMKTVLTFCGVAFILLGLVLSVRSFIAYQQDKDASPTAVYHELRQLEKGMRTDEMHVKFGKSVWLRHQSFLVNKTKDGRDLVDKIYFPLISENELWDGAPFDVILNIDGPPNYQTEYYYNKGMTQSDEIAFILEVDGFDQDPDYVQSEPQFKDSTCGMIRKTADKLDYRIKDHYRSLYPKLDLSKVYVLSYDETPRHFDMFSLQMLLAAFVMLVAGILMRVFDSKDKD